MSRIVAARIIAHGINGQNAHAGSLGEIEHAVHDLRRLAIVLPARTLLVGKRSGKIDGQMFHVEDVKIALPQLCFLKRETQHRRKTARGHQDGLAGREVGAKRLQPARGLTTAAISRVSVTVSMPARFIAYQRRPKPVPNTHVAKKSAAGLVLAMVTSMAKSTRKVSEHDGELAPVQLETLVEAARAKVDGDRANDANGVHVGQRVQVWRKDHQNQRQNHGHDQRQPGNAV